MQDYHRYYAHVEDDANSASRFAREYTARIRGNERNCYIPVVVDWALEPHDTTFFQEHLAPQNLRWCIGFGFFDLADRVRVIFTLDRYATSEAPTPATTSACKRSWSTSPRDGFLWQRRYNEVGRDLDRIGHNSFPVTNNEGNNSPVILGNLPL